MIDQRSQVTSQVSTASEQAVARRTESSGTRPPGLSYHMRKAAEPSPELRKTEWNRSEQLAVVTRHCTPTFSQYHITITRGHFKTISRNALASGSSGMQ